MPRKKVKKVNKPQRLFFASGMVILAVFLIFALFVAKTVWQDTH